MELFLWTSTSKLTRFLFLPISYKSSLIFSKLHARQAGFQPPSAFTAQFHFLPPCSGYFWNQWSDFMQGTHGNLMMDTARAEGQIFTNHSLWLAHRMALQSLAQDPVATGLKPCGALMPLVQAKHSMGLVAKPIISHPSLWLQTDRAGLHVLHLP